MSLYSQIHYLKLNSIVKTLMLVVILQDDIKHKDRLCYQYEAAKSHPDCVSYVPYSLFACCEIFHSKTLLLTSADFFQN